MNVFEHYQKKILSNLKKDIEDQFSQSKNIYILPSSNFNKTGSLIIPAVSSIIGI